MSDTRVPLVGDPSQPLYRRVQQSLLDNIHAQGLQPGERLWSENEIAAMFGVARSVARQALSDLERQGIVDRFRGSGTFLASTTPRDALLSSARGLHANAAAQGQQVTSRVVSHSIDAAPTWVALQLGVEPGTPCAHLIRVRLTDGQPWTYVDSWIVASRVPGLLERDLSQGSLYAILADDYGLMVTSASRSVEAAAASSAIAQALEVTEGDPVLVVRSLGRDPSHQPVDVFTAWHRADRSRFVVEVSNARSGGHVEPLN